MTHLTGVHDDNTQVSEYTPTLSLEPKPNAYPSRTLNLTLGSFSKGEGGNRPQSKTALNPFTPELKKVYSPNLSKSDCMSDVARICSIITFHLRKL